MRRTACLVSVLVAAASGVPRAGAAPEEAPEAEESVDDAVARSLFEQGLKLFHRRQYAEARQLFAESVARSPDGPYARSARQMQARCDARLGPSVGDAPIDPYGAPSAGREAAPLDPYAVEAPQDPYGPEPTIVDPYGDAAGVGPLDPYAGADAERATRPGPAPTGADGGRDTSRSLAVFGGAFGLYTTVGLVAGLGDGTLSGGEMLLVLGGTAGGAFAGHVLAGREPSRAQVAAATSGAAWGAGLGLLFAHAADGAEEPGCRDCADDVPAGQYLLTSALFASAGLGTGLWLASRDPSRGDVALVSSAGGYGLAGGLMLGFVADPEDGQGYSLAAALGGSAGLAVGLVLAPRLELPAGRLAYVDLGVGAGALAPWIFYALSSADGDAEARQLTGVASLGLGALGGWLAWRWTRDVGSPAAPSDDGALAGAPPALLRRDARGAWGLAPVAPRPFVLAPAARDPRPRVGLGVDLVSGAF